MFILAASWLRQTLKTLSSTLQKRVLQSCIAILGLSFNDKATNAHKTHQFQVDHDLSTEESIGIRHDAVKNSISKHRSSNFIALTPNQLKNIFVNYNHNIYAIFYCKPEGTDKN